MLKFSPANAKIEALSQVPELAAFLTGKRKVYSFDLLSGFSCPYAQQCMAKVVEVDGKRQVQDGKHTEFRCFSASQEATFTNVYKLRKQNFDTIRKLVTAEEMEQHISAALPKNAGIVRIHVAGDFFNRQYMQAWIRIAAKNPDRLFYAYTKSVRFWIDNKAEIDTIPNFVLTASRGGKDDHLIKEHSLRESVVVYNEEQADQLGLVVDHDDSHAATPSERHQSFALMLHGIQPKGTAAADALKLLKRNHVKHSYSR